MVHFYHVDNTPYPFHKSCYNLEPNQQSPRHQRGLVLTDGRGGETTSTTTQPLATWPPSGLFQLALAIMWMTPTAAPFGRMKDEVKLYEIRAWV